MSEKRSRVCLRSCPFCEATISIRKRECHVCGNILRKKRDSVFANQSTIRKKAKLKRESSPSKVSPIKTKTPATTSATTPLSKDSDGIMSSQSLGVVSPPLSSSSDSSPTNAPPTSRSPPNNPDNPPSTSQNDPCTSQIPTIPPQKSQSTSHKVPKTTKTGDVMMTSSISRLQPASLPDFMTTLNMTRTTTTTTTKNGTNGGTKENQSGPKTDKEDQNGPKTDKVDQNEPQETMSGNGSLGDEERMEAGKEETEGAKGDEADDEKMEVEEAPKKVTPEESLMEKFKRDPNEVLQLLQSALSMEKLSSLISESHQRDKEQLQQLQTRLEAAYHILKDCSEKKESLTSKINETGEKIKSKRKHLETLREELQALGEEEIHIKRKRDTAYERCSEIKQTLRASRDALHQLSLLTPSVASANNKQPTEHAQTATGPQQGAGKGGTIAEGSLAS